jgi:hypothetical protein
MIKKQLLNILNKIGSFFGFKIFSLSYIYKFNKIFEQAFLLLYSAKKFPKLSDGITCIIFSKDRAIQLYALLESIKLYTSFNYRIIILYKVSNNNYKNSYNELISESKIFSLNIKWIKENGGFKKNLLSILNKINTRRVFFLTDDDIFIDKFNFSSCKNFSCNKFIFSLRLSKNITYSYNEKKKINYPNFLKSPINNKFLEFKWFEGSGEWAYPWSVNGHIFYLNEIKILSEILFYSGPNSYEASLQFFNFLMRNKVGVCSERAKIINNPINIVQNEWINMSGNLTTKDYLSAWKEGKKLNILALKGHNPRSTHEVHELPFINRVV